MPRARSRTKHVAYVLQVQVDKLPEMNEKEFLEEIRQRLHFGNAAVGSMHQPLISRGGGRPTVSVISRTETYLSAKDKP